MNLAQLVKFSSLLAFSLLYAAPLGFNRLLQGFPTCGPQKNFDESQSGITEI